MTPGAWTCVIGQGASGGRNGAASWAWGRRPMSRRRSGRERRPADPSARRTSSPHWGGGYGECWNRARLDGRGRSGRATRPSPNRPRYHLRLDREVETRSLSLGSCPSLGSCHWVPSTGFRPLIRQRVQVLPAPRADKARAATPATRQPITSLRSLSTSASAPSAYAQSSGIRAA